MSRLSVRFMGNTEPRGSSVTINGFSDNIRQLGEFQRFGANRSDPVLANILLRYFRTIACTQHNRQRLIDTGKRMAQFQSGHPRHGLIRHHQIKMIWLLLDQGQGIPGTKTIVT